MKSLINKIKYPQLIAAFFALLILMGSFLLSLPVSSRDGTWTPFVDALFTATSANCVTGVVVYDTYAHWSLFGQLVILALIQIGGIGFMSLATFFSFLLRRKIGLNERILLQEAVGSDRLGGVVRLTKNILLGTLIFEGLGAVLLAFRFCPMMGFWEGLYNAIFHSIAAFCNAGFDIMGKYGHFSSLTTFSGDPYVCIIISFLISVGGIGFLVWNDLMKNKWHWRRYMLHTKVVLFTTAILIFGGAALIFVAEADYTMANMGLVDRVVNSIFHSVTPRTAGFYTVDLGAVSNFTIFLSVCLMIIGGSTGSTAGGIKTTTLFIMVSAVFSTLKNRKDITAFNRRFDEQDFRKACSVFVVFIAVSSMGILLISLFQDISLSITIQNVFAAISTSGLSAGVMADLSAPSKLVMVFLMYFGRVGVLSILFAFMRESGPSQLQYPKEKLIIG